MITDHVWRSGYRVPAGSDSPCFYLNCGKSRAEHAWAFRPRPARRGAAR